MLIPGLFIIGTQVKTDYGEKYGLIDILAMNERGELFIIELKRDKTPRDIVSQTLEYASWVKSLKYEDEPAIELSLKSEIDNVLSISESKPKEQTQECFDCGYNYLCV